MNFKSVTYLVMQVKSNPKCQNCKRSVRSHNNGERRCKIQDGGQEITVMVEKSIQLYLMLNHSEAWKKQHKFI